MKPYLASLINSILLIAMGLWAFVTSGYSSVTALIPVFFGFTILSLNYSFKKGNKVIVHIVVVLTFLIILGLLKPLTGAIGRENNMALFRVLLMLISSIFALVIFIKSFIDARIKKA